MSAAHQLYCSQSADRHRTAFMGWGETGLHWKGADTQILSDSQSHGHRMSSELWAPKSLQPTLEFELHMWSPASRVTHHASPVLLPLVFSTQNGTPCCGHSGQLPHRSAGSAPHVTQSLGAATPICSKQEVRLLLYHVSRPF